MKARKRLLAIMMALVMAVSGLTVFATKSKPMAALLPSLSLSGRKRNVFGILCMTADMDGIFQGAFAAYAEA